MASNHLKGSLLNNVSDIKGGIKYLMFSVAQHGKKL